MKIKIFLISLLISCFFQGFAQTYTFIHNPQLFNQLNSMENGGWNFGPNWYYYITHKNYSGASMRWQWHGFKSGMVISFDETKSNVKRVMTERLLQLAEANEIKKRTQEELDTITPVFIEETKRSLERNVDAIYFQYEGRFKKLESTITNTLAHCIAKSNGKLKEAVTILQNRNANILEEIDYIHQQGPGHEIENTKRQIAYEEALKKLENVAKQSFNLFVYARCFYKMQHGGSLIDPGDIVKPIW